MPLSVVVCAGRPPDEGFWRSVFTSTGLDSTVGLTVLAPDTIAGSDPTAVIVARIRRARASSGGGPHVCIVPFPGLELSDRLRMIYRDMFWLIGAVGSARAEHGVPVRRFDYVLPPKESPLHESEARRLVWMLSVDDVRTPSPTEQGVFWAWTASLRSGGVGGQSGAVLCDPLGELISAGTNEVPKAGGGQYWPDDDHDARDVARFGGDFAAAVRSEVVAEIAVWLSNNGIATVADQSELSERIAKASREAKLPANFVGAVLGRAIHAEESALLSAARRGVSVGGADAFLTNPPCHLCLRHLVMSGVGRVQFLRPGYEDIVGGT